MRNFIGFCRRALDGPMLKYSCDGRAARRQVGPAAGGWASPVGAWDTLWRHQCGNTMPLPRPNASSATVNLRAPRPNNIARRLSRTWLDLIHPTSTWTYWAIVWFPLLNNFLRERAANTLRNLTPRKWQAWLPGNGFDQHEFCLQPVTCGHAVARRGPRGGIVLVFRVRGYTSR